MQALEFRFDFSEDEANLNFNLLKRNNFEFKRFIFTHKKFLPTTDHNSHR